MYVAVSTDLHPRELRIIHVCRGLGLLSQSGNKELYEHQDSGNICAVITVVIVIDIQQLHFIVP